MSNPQQQQQQQQKPQITKHWRFILQSGDQEFATRARRHVQSRYGQGVKVTTDLGTLSLHEDSTIVVLYKDPKRDIKDKDGTRPRRRTTGYGKDRVDGERCEVLESPPVKCDRFYRDSDDNQGSVTLTGENGLIAALHDACKSDPKRAAPVRVQYDDRNKVLQVRAV